MIRALSLLMFLLFSLPLYARPNIHNFSFHLAGAFSFLGDYSSVKDDLQTGSGQLTSTIPLPSSIFGIRMAGLDFTYTYLYTKTPYPLGIDFRLGMYTALFPDGWTGLRYTVLPYIGTGVSLALIRKSCILFLDLISLLAGVPIAPGNSDPAGLSIVVGLPFGIRFLFNSGIILGLRHELELSLYFNGLSLSDFGSLPSLSRASIFKYNLIFSVGYSFGAAPKQGRRR